MRECVGVGVGVGVSVFVGVSVGCGCVGMRGWGVWVWRGERIGTCGCEARKREGGTCAPGDARM